MSNWNLRIHLSYHNYYKLQTIYSEVHDNHAARDCPTGSRPISRNHVYILRLLRNHKRIDIRRISQIYSTVHDNHAARDCLTGSRPISRNLVYLLRLLRNHKCIDIRRISQIYSTVHDNHAARDCLTGSRPIEIKKKARMQVNLHRTFPFISARLIAYALITQ